MLNLSPVQTNWNADSANTGKIASRASLRLYPPRCMPGACRSRIFMCKRAAPPGRPSFGSIPEPSSAVRPRICPACFSFQASPGAKKSPAEKKCSFRQGTASSLYGLLLHLPSQKSCRRHCKLMFRIAHLAIFIFVRNDDRADGVSLADNRRHCLRALLARIV